MWVASFPGFNGAITRARSLVRCGHSPDSVALHRDTQHASVNETIELRKDLLEIIEGVAIRRNELERQREPVQHDLGRALDASAPTKSAARRPPRYSDLTLVSAYSTNPKGFGQRRKLATI